MLEKSLVKLIRSLEHKKFRKRHNLFVAEGPKAVGDIMAKNQPYVILATAEWEPPLQHKGQYRFIRISEEELAKISFLQHPQNVIGVFPIINEQDIENISPDEKLVIVIDGVQDPGNMGTIIRIADWFGIEYIVCSNDTVDAYNPKTVQATMGSLAHVNIIYTDLESLFDRFSGKAHIYGTVLDGEDIYNTQLESNGFIVMGNEGKGISQAIRNRIDKKLLIPNFSKSDTAESLNVAIATAITCSEFLRSSANAVISTI